MPEHVRDLRRRDRLGSRLMVTTLLLACAIGIALNIGQILADSRAQSVEIDRVVNRLTSMMREPATEAAYNIDDRLARRVLDGVFRFDGVVGADLTVGQDEVLAKKERASRWLPTAAKRSAACTCAWTPIRPVAPSCCARRSRSAWA
jgi:hypothetical protein